MTDLSLLSVSRRDFSARTTLHDNSLTAQLVGNADLDVLAAMEALLTELHARAQQDHVGVVTVDLFKLEFMNSSCFKHFVTWLGNIQELAPAAQYRIHFRSNPAMLWQRRSLHALRCFAPELVSIDP
jgi:hypothetical protein